MKEPHGEGLATHTGPESCVVIRKDGSEALTGESAGWVLSREEPEPPRKRRLLRGADAVPEGGRPHPVRRESETSWDPARSETPSMRGRTLHGNREVPRLSVARDGADRTGKSKDERR